MTTTNMPVSTGPSPDTSWLSPYYESWRSGATILRRTLIFIHNPNDQTATVTLTFYNRGGDLLDQCDYYIGPKNTVVWNSSNPDQCVNAAPDGSNQSGWFTIQADVTIAPWGYYFESPTSNPAFAVPLAFYIP
jgi:hypothetical protein